MSTWPDTNNQNGEMQNIHRLQTADQILNTIFSRNYFFSLYTPKKQQRFSRPELLYSIY